MGGHEGTDRWRRVVGTVGAAVGLGALVVTAVHGAGTVARADGKAYVGGTRLAAAVYHCLDVQAHGLVPGGGPVRVGPGLVSPVTFLQATEGSFVLTTTPRRPQIVVTNGTGPDSCHGLVVEARIPVGDGHTVVRRGSGASVPGSGLLPDQL